MKRVLMFWLISVMLLGFSLDFFAQEPSGDYDNDFLRVPVVFRDLSRQGGSSSIDSCRVEEQMVVLNNAFKESGISFYLADKPFSLCHPLSTVFNDLQRFRNEGIYSIGNTNLYDNVNNAMAYTVDGCLLDTTVFGTSDYESNLLECLRDLEFSNPYGILLEECVLGVDCDELDSICAECCKNPDDPVCDDQTESQCDEFECDDCLPVYSEKFINIYLLPMGEHLGFASDYLMAEEDIRHGIFINKDVLPSTCDSASVISWNDDYDEGDVLVHLMGKFLGLEGIYLENGSDCDGDSSNYMSMAYDSCRDRFNEQQLQYLKQNFYLFKHDLYESSVILVCEPIIIEEEEEEEEVVVDMVLNCKYQSNSAWSGGVHTDCCQEYYMDYDMSCFDGSNDNWDCDYTCYLEYEGCTTTVEECLVSQAECFDGSCESNSYYCPGAYNTCSSADIGQCSTGFKDCSGLVYNNSACQDMGGNCFDVVSGMMGDGECHSGDNSRFSFNLNCEAFGFDGGDCCVDGNCCGEGFVPDCSINQCCSESWLNDDFCDDGTYGSCDLSCHEEEKDDCAIDCNEEGVVECWDGSCVDDLADCLWEPGILCSQLPVFLGDTAQCSLDENLEAYVSSLGIDPDDLDCEDLVVDCSGSYCMPIDLFNNGFCEVSLDSWAGFNCLVFEDDDTDCAIYEDDTCPAQYDADSNNDVELGASGYVLDCSEDQNCCPFSYVGDGICDDSSSDCDLTCYEEELLDCYSCEELGDINGEILVTCPDGSCEFEESECSTCQELGLETCNDGTCVENSLECSCLDEFGPEFLPSCTTCEEHLLVECDNGSCKPTLGDCVGCAQTGMVSCVEGCAITYDDCPDDCEEGFVMDCSGDGDCCPVDWIGDGYADCEDQAYGCDLTCYDNDFGDCDSRRGGDDCCPISWVGDGYPDCEDQQYGCDLSCYGYAEDNSGVVVENDWGYDGGDCEWDTCGDEMVYCFNNNEICSLCNFDFFVRKEACDGGEVACCEGGDRYGDECDDETEEQCCSVVGETYEFCQQDCFAVGDVNLDGNVNVVDIVKVVNFVMGTVTPTAFKLSLADLNVPIGDGLLNVIDVVILVNIIVSSK